MINGKYTVLLKTLMEHPETRSLLEKAMSTYPLYTSTSKEEYIPSIIPTREELNRKILNHYKYREIGFETPARFFDELEIALNEIMVYYNQLYMTADQDYNIIFNVDYKRTIDRDLGGTSKSKTTGSGSSVTDDTSNGTNSTTGSDSTTSNTTMSDNGKTVKSQTPQSELTVPADGIDSVSYADEVNWNKNTSTSNGTTSGTNNANSTTTSTAKSENTSSSTVDVDDEKSETESTVETTKGNFGVVSAQDLVQKYREIILNIDQMIINDIRIAELFMTVY